MFAIGLGVAAVAGGIAFAIHKKKMDDDAAAAKKKDDEAAKAKADATSEQQALTATEKRINELYAAVKVPGK